ncbi:MAG: DMT family transporter [Pseudomonadota bacterium]
MVTQSGGERDNVGSSTDLRQEGVQVYALLYLVIAGSLLGLSTTLAKVASDWALAPFPFLTWSLLGATCILIAAGAVRGRLPRITGRAIEYYGIAALVTVAGSNLIFYSAVPIVGAGFVALAITLPPLLTYGGALMFRLEGFSLIRFLGVLSALLGAGLLAVNKIEEDYASVSWIALTLAGPVLLAIGNIYRTLRWPPGASAEELAPGMLVAATLMLFAVSFLPHFSLWPSEFTAAHAMLIALQAIIFASYFLVTFLLQKTGGPVFLSLLGSVGAIVAVPVAILLLGENVPGGLAYATALIGLGIVLLNQRRA